MIIKWNLTHKIASFLIHKTKKMRLCMYWVDNYLYTIYEKSLDKPEPPFQCVHQPVFFCIIVFCIAFSY